MKLGEIMTPDPTCVEPDTSIEEAASTMDMLDTGFLPICDRDRLAGVITDRDIVVRAVAAGVDPKSTPVRDVMTNEVVWCYDDMDVDHAAERMEAEQVRRLLVLDRGKRLVGIVSLGDLAVRTADNKMSGKVLEAVSASHSPF